MSLKSFPELKFPRQLGRVLFSPKRPYSISLSKNEIYLLCKALDFVLSSGSYNDSIHPLLVCLNSDLYKLYHLDKTNK